MPAGRKPRGIEQVEQLPGSELARQRLEVLLGNLGGTLTVAQACAALGVHESRFFELRRSWLQESVAFLEPEAPGRPAVVVTEEQRRIAELERQNRELQFQLQAAQVREDLAASGLWRRPAATSRSKKTPR